MSEFGGSERWQYEDDTSYKEKKHIRYIYTRENVKIEFTNWYKTTREQMSLYEYFIKTEFSLQKNKKYYMP